MKTLPSHNFVGRWYHHFFKLVPPPANKVTGRLSFQSCLSVIPSVHGGGGFGSDVTITHDENITFPQPHLMTGNVFSHVCLCHFVHKGGPCTSCTGRRPCPSCRTVASLCTAPLPPPDPTDMFKFVQLGPY